MYVLLPLLPTVSAWPDVVVSVTLAPDGMPPVLELPDTASTVTVATGGLGTSRMSVSVVVVENANGVTTPIAVTSPLPLSTSEKVVEM